MELSTPGDEGTKNAFLDVFLADAYGMRSLRTAPRTVLDIGAHVGFFSLLSRMLYPAAQVHAYEPNPSLWSHLSAHARKSGFVAHPAGVGSSAGRATLVAGRDSVFTQTKRDRLGDVEVRSLAAAVAGLGGRVDLLKLDCEGAEWDILRDQATMGSVDRVAMEYHLVERHSLDELVGLLRGLGFAISLLAEDHPTCGRALASRF